MSRSCTRRIRRRGWRASQRSTAGALNTVRPPVSGRGEGEGIPAVTRVRVVPRWLSARAARSVDSAGRTPSASSMRSARSQ